MAGCEGPCAALASKICGCEPNRSAEAACLQTVRSAMNFRPTVTEAENAACERLLDTCTCTALEDNDLLACGLAKAKE